MNQTRITRWAAFQNYWTTPLRVSPHPKQRMRAYLTYMGFIFLVILTVQLSHTISEVAAIAVCIYCSAKTALIFAVCMFVTDEWLVRLLFPQWGALSTRTVGKFWLIWLIGFLVGFAVATQNIWNFDVPYIKQWTGVSATSPIHLNAWEEMARAFPIWVGLTFFIIQSHLKRQLQEELAEISRINQTLNQKHAVESAPPSLDSTTIVPPSEPTVPPSPVATSSPTLLGTKKFIVSNSETTKALAPESISHIEIEEHYSHIFFKEQEAFEKVIVKLSLKKALEQLPPELFVQVHRSYAVNMAHVYQIQRESGTYMLSIDKGQFSIPVSRQRARTVLPQLENFWQSQ